MYTVTSFLQRHWKTLIFMAVLTVAAWFTVTQTTVFKGSVTDFMIDGASHSLTYNVYLEKAPGDKLTAAEQNAAYNVTAGQYFVAVYFDAVNNMPNTLFQISQITSPILAFDTGATWNAADGYVLRSVTPLAGVDTQTIGVDILISAVTNPGTRSEVTTELPLMNFSFNATYSQPEGDGTNGTDGTDGTDGTEEDASLGAAADSSQELSTGTDSSSSEDSTTTTFTPTYAANATGKDGNNEDIVIPLFTQTSTDAASVDVYGPLYPYDVNIVFKPSDDDLDNIGYTINGVKLYYPTDEATGTYVADPVEFTFPENTAVTPGGNDVTARATGVNFLPDTQHTIEISLLEGEGNDQKEVKFRHVINGVAVPVDADTDETDETENPPLLGGTWCGDGIVQNPNSVGGLESCDTGVMPAPLAVPGLSAGWAATCEPGCVIKLTPPAGTSVSEIEKFFSSATTPSNVCVVERSPVEIKNGNIVHEIYVFPNGMYDLEVNRGKLERIEVMNPTTRIKQYYWKHRIALGEYIGQSGNFPFDPQDIIIRFANGGPEIYAFGLRHVADITQDGLDLADFGEVMKHVFPVINKDTTQLVAYFVSTLNALLKP